MVFFSLLFYLKFDATFFCCFNFLLFSLQIVGLGLDQYRKYDPKVKIDFGFIF